MDATETIVNWWASQIEKRTYGDPRIDGFVGAAARNTHNLMQRDIVVTAAQLDTFRAALRRELTRESFCAVDYQPTIPLANAMKEAGIPSNVLGGKIHTRIESGVAYAAVGYGAEYEAIN